MMANVASLWQSVYEIMKTSCTLAIHCTRQLVMVYIFITFRSCLEAQVGRGQDAQRLAKTFDSESVDEYHLCAQRSSHFEASTSIQGRQEKIAPNPIRPQEMPVLDAHVCGHLCLMNPTCPQELLLHIQMNAEKYT